MERISVIFEKVRKERPLVHHITNWVTIYDCANVLRTVGALPVMAHAREEVSEMTHISSALVFNIGTLSTGLVESMKIAGKTANKEGKPIVLDAVGAGATSFRNEKVLELIRELKIDVIKGNRSEIASISGLNVLTRGVESTEVAQDMKEIAWKLAREREATVIVTGKEDIVADRNSVYLCQNGHPMMGNIVGTGCMAASLAGAFAAVDEDYAMACLSSLAVFGIAGEIAAGKSFGPGSFKQNLYDALYNLSGNDIKELVKTEKAA